MFILSTIGLGPEPTENFFPTIGFSAIVPILTAHAKFSILIYSENQKIFCFVNLSEFFCHMLNRTKRYREDIEKPIFGLSVLNRTFFWPRVFVVQFRETRFLEFLSIRVKCTVAVIVFFSSQI